MLIKFIVVLATLSLATTGINAQTRSLQGGGGGVGGDNYRGLQGGRGGRPGRPGRPGDGRPERPEIPERPERPAFPGGGGGGGGGPPTNEPPAGDLVDLQCESDDNEPACGSGTGGPGDWLCRTIVDPATQVSESFSTCGNAASALPEDACGCCGECPVQCTCACALEGALEGVEDGVLVAYYFPSGVEDDDRCLTPLRAISLIANPADRFSCAVCP
jgi:hypothetical protein